ncbi:MAG: ABC transporter ATP-binding protein [Oscillospiraceae bacterium]|jgi:peptide/nickel transport system ATP-binding protein|nr:ABC transporter ATP-binding protein [Oscillospiraceae bacterium]
MGAILTVKDLNVTYINKTRRVMAVRRASFSIDKGDSLGIVGESGSGKSTLAMALLRLHPKSTEITGEALFDGKDLLSISEAEMNELRWMKLAVVFQKAMNALSPVHRISTQIEDIYRVHCPSASGEEIQERAMELLKLVNLPPRVYRLYPHEMSGGMLQRVAIAISLLHHPQLLIFDEATTALDVVTQGQILREILEMEKTLETTRIMITHDMSVVATTCNKVAVMYAGELMEFGMVKDVLTRPRHPYTQGLQDSFPSLKGENPKLLSIPGFLPDLSKDIPGCVFAPRCAHATERCRREKPPMTKTSEAGQAACWLCVGDENGK